MAKIRSCYKRLEARYGSRWAVAIVGVGLLGLPIPLPGTSFLLAAPVVGIAEVARLVRG